MKVQHVVNGCVYLCLLGLLLIGYVRTAPLRYGSFAPEIAGETFLVIGDNRSGNHIYREIVQTIVSSLSFARFVVHTGDMIISPGNMRQWKRFMQMNAPLATAMPWYGVVGNYDVGDAASQQIYQEQMSLPGNELFYSVDALQSHFIMLDTEIPGQVGMIGGEQLRWLKEDLHAHAASAKRVFVFTHRTLFPQGFYKGRNLANADELHRLFVRYGVDVVFSGNEHQYYTFRKDAVQYVVTGGAGAPIYVGGIGESVHHLLLVELLPDHLMLHVLDIHGKVLQQEAIFSCHY